MKKPIKDIFDMADTISATECTGMIQIPPQNKEEYNSYLETYEFFDGYKYNNRKKQ